MNPVNLTKPVDLPQDEPGELDPDHTARRAWREEGGKLEAMAEDMLRPEDVHAPYLDAEPGAREAIRQAAAEVRDALRDDRYRTFGWLAAEVVRQARETRTEAFHVPRYGEMVAQAEALSGQAELPARTQELVDSWLDYHARCQPICRQIRDWPARVDALTADCPEPAAPLDSLSDWRQRAEPLLAEARAMLVKDGPHARHLAAMPSECEALVERTSRLDRALLAVEAREMNLLSADVQRSTKETGGIALDSRDANAILRQDGPEALRALPEPLTHPIPPAPIAALDELHRDWQAHIAEAKAAHVHHFYLPHHDELINRLQQLRDDPEVKQRPATELKQIDALLQQDLRQVQATSHVQKYLADVEHSRQHLEQLQELAYSYKFPLEKVHSYDKWHDTAQRLSMAGQAIIDDKKTYGPCLNHVPNAWQQVHASVDALNAALGRDPTSLRQQQPQLYLEPITRAIPTSEPAAEADASYRRVRTD